jgi:hypothetical protein
MFGDSLFDLSFDRSGVQGWAVACECDRAQRYGRRDSLLKEAHQYI